jgi:hypothetical protein
MHNCAIAGFLAFAFAVIGICGMVPVQAQTQELAFGKHRVTVGPDFAIRDCRLLVSFFNVTRPETRGRGARQCRDQPGPCQGREDCCWQSGRRSLTS